MAAIIEDSYQALSQAETELMCGLGVLPHADIPVTVAAAALTNDLAGLDAQVERVGELLDVLVELSLIDQVDDTRFRLHEVVYRFCRATASEREPDWRHQVIANGCRAYAALMYTAASSIGFTDKQGTQPASTNEQAFANLEIDRLGVVALIAAAHREQLWDPMITAVWGTAEFLRLRGYWDDFERIHLCVRDAGTATDNHDWLASAMINLGKVAAHRGDIETASDHYRTGVEAARHSDEPATLHYGWSAIADILMQQGRCGEAMAIFRRTLRAWRLLGNAPMLAQTLTNIGSTNLWNGRWGTAEAYLRNAHRLATARGIGPVLTTIEHNLAVLYRLTGRHELTEQQLRRSLERSRAVGDRDGEGSTLLEMGVLAEHNKALGAGIDCFSDALRLFVELDDAKGQVNALRLRGASRSHIGDVEQASHDLDECRDLALRTGDLDQAALVSAELGKLWADAGNFDEAEHLFADAERLAAMSGNTLIGAQVQSEHASALMVRGRAGDAVDRMRRVVGTLEPGGVSDALITARVTLAEALLHNDDVSQASTILSRALAATDVPLRPTTRAHALRLTAQIYSKRKLPTEAEQAARQALSICQEADSDIETMRCQLTLGNVLARSEQWQQAREQYRQAATIAHNKHQMFDALTIGANFATCLLRNGETSDAIDQLRKVMDIASKLQLAEMQVSLQSNLAGAYADTGNLNAAISEWSLALNLAERCANSALAATILQNLSRAYRQRGDYDVAADSAQQARLIHQQRQDWHAAAEALMLELAARCAADEDAEISACLQDIIAKEPGLPRGVMAALSARMHTPNSQEPPAHSVRIRISDAVREALPGIDIDSIAATVFSTKRACHICALPLADTATAELLVLSDQATMVLRLAVAHPGCCASAIVNAQPSNQPSDRVSMEIECAILDGGQPAVIVDCRGGWGVDPDTGQAIDVCLDLFRAAGFSDISGTVAIEPTRGVALKLRRSDTSLTAQLVGNKLNLALNGAPLLDAHLSFLPAWYRTTRCGQLLVAVGRNLHGMTWENPEHILRAAQDGLLVGMIVPLSITAPSRNARCVCEPATGLKYKRCCGK